jgi:hypothetical protein
MKKNRKQFSRKENIDTKSKNLDNMLNVEESLNSKMNFPRQSDQSGQYEELKQSSHLTHLSQSYEFQTPQSPRNEEITLSSFFPSIPSIPYIPPLPSLSQIHIMYPSLIIPIPIIPVIPGYTASPLYDKSHTSFKRIEDKELQVKQDKEDKELQVKQDKEDKELQVKQDKEDKELQDKQDKEDKELQVKQDKEDKELQVKQDKEDEDKNESSEFTSLSLSLSIKPHFSSSAPLPEISNDKGIEKLKLLASSCNDFVPVMSRIPSFSKRIYESVYFYDFIPCGYDCNLRSSSISSLRLSYDGMPVEISDSNLRLNFIELIRLNILSVSDLSSLPGISQSQWLKWINNNERYQNLISVAHCIWNDIIKNHYLNWKSSSCLPNMIEIEKIKIDTILFIRRDLYSCGQIFDHLSNLFVSEEELSRVLIIYYHSDSVNLNKRLSPSPRIKTMYYSESNINHMFIKDIAQVHSKTSKNIRFGVLDSRHNFSEIHFKMNSVPSFGTDLLCLYYTRQRSILDINLNRCICNQSDIQKRDSLYYISLEHKRLFFSDSLFLLGEYLSLFNYMITNNYIKEKEFVEIYDLELFHFYTSSIKSQEHSTPSLQTSLPNSLEKRFKNALYDVCNIVLGINYFRRDIAIDIISFKSKNILLCKSIVLNEELDTVSDFIDTVIVFVFETISKEVKQRYVSQCARFGLKCIITPIFSHLKTSFQSSIIIDVMYIKLISPSTIIYSKCKEIYNVLTSIGFFVTYLS